MRLIFEKYLVRSLPRCVLVPERAGEARGLGSKTHSKTCEGSRCRTKSRGGGPCRHRLQEGRPRAPGSPAEAESPQPPLPALRRFLAPTKALRTPHLRLPPLAAERFPALGCRRLPFAAAVAVAVVIAIGGRSPGPGRRRVLHAAGQRRASEISAPGDPNAARPESGPASPPLLAVAVPRGPTPLRDWLLDRSERD